MPTNDLELEYKLFREELAALAARRGYPSNLVGMVDARVQTRLGQIRAVRGMAKAAVIPIKRAACGKTKSTPRLK